MDEESKSVIVQLETDPETGDIMMPISEEIMKQMGWTAETELYWEVNEHNQIQIKAKTE